MFQTYFNPNNSLLIILQISLLFRLTPALKKKKKKKKKIGTPDRRLGRLGTAKTLLQAFKVLFCFWLVRWLLVFWFVSLPDCYFEKSENKTFNETLPLSLDHAVDWN